MCVFTRPQELLDARSKQNNSPLPPLPPLLPRPRLHRLLMLKKLVKTNRPLPSQGRDEDQWHLPFTVELLLDWKLKIKIVKLIVVLARLVHFYCLIFFDASAENNQADESDGDFGPARPVDLKDSKGFNESLWNTIEILYIDVGPVKKRKHPAAFYKLHEDRLPCAETYVPKYHVL